MEGIFNDRTDDGRRHLTNVFCGVWQKQLVTAINLATLCNTAVNSDVKPLVFANFLAPNMTLVYAAVAERVGQVLGMPAELIEGRDFDQLRDGSVDLAFLCGLPYVRLSQERPGTLHPLVAPVLDEIARDNPDKLRIAKVNIDENLELARRFEVMSIPTLILFKDGEPQLRIIGAKGKGQLLEELQAVGIAFVSLNEGIDATTPAGKLQIILGAVAEFERARIAERVKAGLVRARAQGKRLGRPRKARL